MAEAFHGDWYFVANDIDLLHSTLDAAARKTSPEQPRRAGCFQTRNQPIASSRETRCFSRRSARSSERLISLMAASGQAADPKQIEESEEDQGGRVGSEDRGSSMAGHDLRAQPRRESGEPPCREAPPPSPRQRRCFIMPRRFRPRWRFRNPPSRWALLFPASRRWRPPWRRRGLKWSDFGKAFGPELGTVLDWKADAAQPSALFALDVRDARQGQRICGCLHRRIGRRHALGPQGREWRHDLSGLLGRRSSGDQSHDGAHGPFPGDWVELRNSGAGAEAARRRARP